MSQILLVSALALMQKAIPLKAENPVDDPVQKISIMRYSDHNA